jgi:hypothetical protein
MRAELSSNRSPIPDFPNLGSAGGVLTEMLADGEELVDIAFDAKVEAPAVVTRASQMSLAGSYLLARREG